MSGVVEKNDTQLLQPVFIKNWRYQIISNQDPGGRPWPGNFTFFLLSKTQFSPFFPSKSKGPKSLAYFIRTFLYFFSWKKPVGFPTFFVWEQRNRPAKKKPRRFSVGKNRKSTSLGLPRFRSPKSVVRCFKALNELMHVWEPQGVAVLP